MAPSIIYNDAIQGEVFLPRQIFVFGGFALRANSRGHLEQIDSYAPGHQVRFGSLNYAADMRGDLIFDGFEPMTATPCRHDEHDLNPAFGLCAADSGCNRTGPRSIADHAIRGREAQCHDRFSGYQFPEKDRRAHQPQDYC